MKPTLLVGVIGVVLGGLIGYHGIYARHAEQRRLIYAQIAQEQTDQQMQAEGAALLTQIEQYRKRLPEEPDPSWLVREAVELGQKAGLELTTISQESPKPFAQFVRLAIILQFTATYHQLGTFLDYLEGSERFIRVDHLDLQSPRDASGPASVGLTLSTFYLPPFSVAEAAASSRKKSP